MKERWEDRETGAWYTERRQLGILGKKMQERGEFADLEGYFKMKCEQSLFTEVLRRNTVLLLKSAGWL